jgi:hyperosmotically inducible protein
MTARLLVALVFALLLPAAAAAQSEADARVHDDVSRSLRAYRRLTIFDDLDVQVRQGVVTLSGKVTMPFKKHEVGERVAAVEGVRELRNEIGVLPVSNEDDDLRKRVARAIYGNPAFHRYAALPNPPVHIIVEHGRVTLAGVVPSEVDRMLARSLAAGHGERKVTCALRTDAERAP